MHGCSEKIHGGFRRMMKEEEKKEGTVMQCETKTMIPVRLNAREVRN